MPSRHRLALVKNSVMKFCLSLVHLMHHLKDNRRLATWKIEMRYEGISSVVYGQISDTMKPYRNRSFLDSTLAGRDDSLSIRSR
jgi:hypothetical protein